MVVYNTMGVNEGVRHIIISYMFHNIIIEILEISLKRITVNPITEYEVLL